MLSTEPFGEEGVDAFGLGVLVAVAAEPAERVDGAGVVWLTVVREVLLDDLGRERLGGDSGARCSAFESSRKLVIEAEVDRGHTEIVPAPRLLGTSTQDLGLPRRGRAAPSSPVRSERLRGDGRCRRR